MADGRLPCLPLGTLGEDLGHFEEGVLFFPVVSVVLKARDEGLSLLKAQGWQHNEGSNPKTGRVKRPNQHGKRPLEEAPFL